MSRYEIDFVTDDNMYGRLRFVLDDPEASDDGVKLRVLYGTDREPSIWLTIDAKVAGSREELRMMLRTILNNL